MTIETKPTKGHAAIYLRVSTDRQSVENQRAECVQLAEARGLSFEVFEETESAVKRRPVWEGIQAEARKGKLRAVIVWALDRMGRSMVGMLTDVLELDRVGVALVSVRDAWLDTSGPARSILIAFAGWAAEQERERLRERISAGLAVAKRKGKRLGRPRASPVLLGSAADAVSRGVSRRKAAQLYGVSDSALRRHLAREGAVQ
jgi:putative DNA-invertase from lambdoid prophage Rac